MESRTHFSNDQKSATTLKIPMPLGPTNTVTTCPHCESNVKTGIKYTTTTRTHMVALYASFLCFCCCFPYCCNSTRNTDHYCPSCQKYLGTYEK